jgi:hypothetical protein
MKANLGERKVVILIDSLNSITARMKQDGTKCISGGADKAARMMDVTTGQTQQVSRFRQSFQFREMFSFATVKELGLISRIL